MPSRAARAAKSAFQCCPSHAHEGNHAARSPICQIGHAFAQHLRAQAAAEGDDDGLPLLRAQRAACGGTVLPEHLLPHRVARNDRLVRRAQTLHGVGHGREHQVHLLCQDLVGHAGESVLLVNGRADAPAGRGLHHRPADVPARADDKVRLYLPQDGAGARAAQRQVPKGNQVPRDVLRRQAALDAVHLDGMERITRLGDKAVLHSLLPSGEVYLRVRMAFFSAPAMASAGLMCPAVPPAAINTRIGTSCFRAIPHGSRRRAAPENFSPAVCPRSKNKNADARPCRAPLYLLRAALAGDRKHNAHLAQQHQQGRASVGKNGRLMPVFGMVFVTTAIFSTACSVTCTITPTTSMEPNLSFACHAT